MPDHASPAIPINGGTEWTRHSPLGTPFGFETNCAGSGEGMKKALLSAAAMVAALTGMSAYAQESSDEIIVTAQRREQAAQDVGVALSVVSGQALIDNGVTVVNGLETLVPSLEIESQFGGGQPSFSLRGVGFKDYASNNAPTVGVYVDDVAYTLPVLTQGVLYDVARVEVLRGPQGTLYGRNTTGGAINIITNRPTEDFGAGVTVDYDSDERIAAEGYLSGAITPGVLGRLSFSTAQGGAWQTNRETGRELGDDDQVAVRGQLAFETTERLSFLFNVHAFEDNSDGLGLQLFKTTAAGVAHGDDQTSWGSSPVFAASTGISVDTAPFRDNTGWGASLTTTYAFDFADLTYIAAIETLDRREFNDWDAVPSGVAGVLFESDVNVQSHEIRLASKGDDAFDWIAGIYYANEDLDELYQSDFGASFGPDFQYVRTPYRQEVQTLGIFGQIEAELMADLNLVAGIRYEDEERDLRDLGTFANGFGTFNFANGTVDGTLENRSTSMNEVSGRLALEWTPSDDVLYYASISRGVKSGGFTAYNTLDSRAINPFDPEILVAYEAGVKSNLFDNRLQLNGAVYYYDYTDQQVQGAIFVTLPAPAVVGRIVNAPKSEILGAEIEAIWRASDNLTIAQALGYQNGEFEEFNLLDTANPPATIDKSGERLGPPELTYSGSIAYERELANGHGVRGSVDYSYRSDTDPPLLNPVAGEGYGVDGYWLVNANVAYRFNENWEVGVFGRNILDEDYEETRNFFAGADFTPVSAPGHPATYGVRINYRY